MNEIVLRISGKPVGKGRPRFVKATGRTFTDAKTQSAEVRVLDAWHEAGEPRLPDGPIEFVVVQAVARPKTHWKVNGTLSAAGERAPWPTGRKPDFDNALKLLADALNGAAYRDDVDIVHSRYTRRWANPGESENTTIVLRSITVGLNTLGAAA